MERVSNSEQETKTIAKEFLKELLSKDLPKPLIIELIGDLGAGKTTFMKGVGEFFGIKEIIISPTFLIQRNYNITGIFPFKKLIHLDAYRIEDQKEIDSIDWKNYSNNPDNIIFIEWSKNMEDYLPDGSIKIEFSYENETNRKIKYEI
jgi:tRNA threonylcarbamoyladenosine biosynthesis protein TsaE